MIMRKIDDQEWSESYVVFTEILCRHMALITTINKLAVWPCVSIKFKDSKEPCEPKLSMMNFYLIVHKTYFVEVP